MRKPAPAFLTAQWLHVLGVTYAVDAALLQPHLPRGAQIDVLEGSPRVSIVAFVFRRTRLRGVAIPLHLNFGEINLRFYVRLHDRRAVVFIGEFVSRPAIFGDREAHVQRALPDDPHARRGARAAPRRPGRRAPPGGGCATGWRRGPIPSRSRRRSTRRRTG